MLSGQDDLEVAVDSMFHGAFYYIEKTDGAYVKTQFIVNKILKYQKATRDLQTQKMITRILIVAFTVLIGAIIIISIFFPNLLTANGTV